MDKEEIEQRLLTVFSQQKLENYGIGLAIYYLAKVIEEKLDNKGELSVLRPAQNPSNELPFNILSVFNPADRLDELDEIPKIDGDIDYWTVAKLLCEKDGGHLATREELAQLASNLYVDGAENNIMFVEDIDRSGMQLRKQYKDNPLIPLGYHYWSSTGFVTNDFAYGRSFTSSSTYWGIYKKSLRHYNAICISNKVK